MTTGNRRIVLGGVRGSASLSQADFMRFGGSTTSVLVEDGTGTRIVIDGGTGLRTLSHRLAASSEDSPVLMLFTHFHLDHLTGLPPFPPLYNPNWHIVFASPPCEGVTAEEALGKLIGKPFWPAPFLAQRRFVVLPEACDGEPWRQGPFDVRWCALRHCFGCFAYRIDDRASGASVVLATDLDWRSSNESERASLIRFCREPRPANVLITEGYAPDSPFANWGHCAWPDSVHVAQAADVGRLVITHHATNDDDGVLLRREREIQSVFPRTELGYEGMVIPW